jgi:hypothetical protein
MRTISSGGNKVKTKTITKQNKIIKQLLQIWKEMATFGRMSKEQTQ